MNDQRLDLDELLRAHGAAPAHLPGFAARLAAGLADADAEMGRATGTAGAAGRRRLRLPRLRLPWTRHFIVAAAFTAGVAAVIAAVVLVGIPGVSRVVGPETVSAAEVIQRALRALSQAETLQADCTGKIMVARRSDGTPKYVVEHSRLLMRSDGSSLYTLTDKPDTSVPAWNRGRDDARVTAYDAVHGIYRDYFRGWDPEVGPHGRYDKRYEVTTGYPLGQPDFGGWDTSATGRAILAGGRATLETTTFEGRPVWEITIHTGAATGLQLPKDEIAVITIDQGTCLPIGTRLIQDGVTVLDDRWRNVVVDEPLPDETFTLDPPEGARIIRRDLGFRRLTLAQIAAATQYAPLVPAWIPGGFDLEWTALADRFKTEEGTTSGRDVVHLQYVRGFDALTVTTRIADDPGDAATLDPIDEWSWADLMRRDVELADGAFAGVTARVVVGPWISSPHLYAVKDGILLTIAGSATADELVKIAESLEP
jgi:hypothetical protein